MLFILSRIQLGNFTASQLASLLQCNLSGNSHSKTLWKMLLSKLSFVLDPALDILGRKVCSFFNLLFYDKHAESSNEYKEVVLCHSPQPRSARRRWRFWMWLLR